MRRDKGEKAYADDYAPYANDPSMKQRLLEILSFLILITAVPLFLGGVYAIFLSYFAFALGLIGLFAWTRRHALLYAFLALTLIIATIVGLILRATGPANCLPFFQILSVRRVPYYWQTPGAQVYPSRFLWDNDDKDGGGPSLWCGNDILAYIVEGILLALLLPALLLALLVAREGRYDRARGDKTTVTRTVATA